MEPVSAHDVAREIRARVSGVGALKLQKLLYYCQGWHLALTGQPLFSEPIEAWTNGPVVADLWHAEDKSYAPPEPATLSPEQLATVAYIAGRYRSTSGAQLKDKTHDEPPWFDAVNRADDANPEISHVELAEYFGSLLDPDVQAAVDAAQQSDKHRRALDDAREQMQITPPSPDEPGWLESELERL